MQAGDGRAGTEGKCPRCGQRLIVPGAAPAPPASLGVRPADLRASPPPPPPPVPPRQQPTVSCPSCGGVMSADSALAGRAVSCPFCGAAFVMPGGPSHAQVVVLPDAPPPPQRQLREEDDDDRPRRREGFRCVYCGTTAPPEVRSKISTAGWVTFVVLLLVCFPVCIVALFIKEEYRVCSSCGITLG